MVVSDGAPPNVVADRRATWEKGMKEGRVVFLDGVASLRFLDAEGNFIVEDAMAYEDATDRPDPVDGERLNNDTQDPNADTTGLGTHDLEDEEQDEPTNRANSNIAEPSRDDDDALSPVMDPLTGFYVTEDELRAIEAIRRSRNPTQLLSRDAQDSPSPPMSSPFIEFRNSVDEQHELEELDDAFTEFWAGIHEEQEQHNDGWISLASSSPALEATESASQESTDPQWTPQDDDSGSMYSLEQDNFDDEQISSMSDAPEPALAPVDGITQAPATPQALSQTDQDDPEVSQTTPTNAAADRHDSIAPGQVPNTSDSDVNSVVGSAGGMTVWLSWKDSRRHSSSGLRETWF
jgi:hypothetical protein